MPQRGKFSADFKAKAALEALTGELTPAELARGHEHPTRIAGCKRPAKEGMVAAFPGRRQPCRRMPPPKSEKSMPRSANSRWGNIF